MILSIGPLGTNLSEILIKIQNFSFTRIDPEISFTKWWPFCPGGRWVNTWNASRFRKILLYPKLTHWDRDTMAATSQTIPYPEPVVFQWQSSVPGTYTQVYTGMSREKELLVASALPVVFQWLSSGLPVVFQCVSIMQINTGSPLEHHWVLASASVVSVASQCTCGSSGLPVWSVQCYPSVLTESGLEVIRSGHFPVCDPLCKQLVWWELFELNWFNLTCNPKYTKTIMVLISKACTG